MREAIQVGAIPVEFILGDSLEVMDSMAAGSVDVVATSPPYNLGVKYGPSVDDSVPRRDYLEWTGRWLDGAWRLLAPDGSLFLNMGSKPTNPLGPEQVLLLATDEGRERRFFLQNKIAWTKSVTVRVRTRRETIEKAAAKADLTVGQVRRLLKAITEVEGPDGEERTIGHVKPLEASQRFVNDAWEVVYHLTKACDVRVDKHVPGLGIPYEDKANLRRWGGTRESGRELRCRGNVWVVPYETIQSRDRERPHPATFPPRIAEMCFLLHGKDRIKSTLDPFSGIGSSAEAAVRLGLPHVGIEIEERNYAEAVRRMRERPVAESA